MELLDNRNIKAEIVLDSIANGERLTTFKIQTPKSINAELNTHRVFSRNASSSRAIPFNKMVERIKDNPFIPSDVRINQSGMQGYEQLSKKDYVEVYDELYNLASETTEKLLKLSEKYNVHKQHLNRYIEPFMNQTILITATDYGNFFYLRNDGPADPMIKDLAAKMWECYSNSTPKKLKAGEWHIPLLSDDELHSLPLDIKLKVSTARCARSSYDNWSNDKLIWDDVELHDKLIKAGHMSPAEHQATPYSKFEAIMNWVKKPYDSNLKLWKQYRKTLPIVDWEKTYWVNHDK